MKKLDKINLPSAVFLEEQELKTILGGSGSDGGSSGSGDSGSGSGSFTGGCFSCRCYGGTNPPFASIWMKFYVTAQGIVDDLNQKCVNGSGTCSRIDLC
jgi:natural product precursor